jgi:LPS export ABC transporter protein LptC
MKMSRKLVIIFSTVFVAAVVVAAYFVADGDKTSGKKLLKIVTDNVDLQVKDVLYTDVGESGLKWEVRADSAQYMKSEKLAQFDKIRVKLVLADGKTISMVGDKGKLHTDTKDMEITGNVEIVSDRGDRLTTDIIKYSGSEQRFYTDSPVKLENARLRIKGVGMSLSIKDRDVTLLSKVKAIVE